MCPGIYKKSFPTVISRMYNQPLCLFHQIKEKGHFGLVLFRNIYPEIPVVLHVQMMLILYSLRNIISKLCFKR